MQVSALPLPRWNPVAMPDRHATNFLPRAGSLGVACRPVPPAPHVQPTADPASVALERDRVRRAQAGDRQALGELLRQHGPALYRSLLLPRLGSAAAAEDALSETYTKVLRSLGSFEWRDEVGFYPWFRTIGLRVVLDQFRRRKKQLVWSDDDVTRELDREAQAHTERLDDAIIQERDAAVVREKLEQALLGLHPRYAEAIRRRILAEEPREGVAAALGVSPATFDVVLHRALAALKKKLSP